MDTIDRTRRAELLAVADGDEVCAIADRLLATLGTPTVTSPPETGLVMMQVREPVARERFHLGEVMVSRAEVDWHGHAGWAMRLGSDVGAALAAAMCDAAAEVDPAAAAEIDALCRRTAARRRADADTEWANLAATRVSFEELD